MKKVVSPETVAHYWANQVQDAARNAGHSFYFYGDTIYSYGSHFPIAKHVEYNGRKAVLFTTRSYSVTTSTHINITEAACRHKNILYCHNPEGSHEVNLGSFKAHAEEAGAKLQTARKPELYLNAIAEQKRQAIEYADYFQIDIAKNFPAVWSALTIADKEQYFEYASKKAALELKETKKRNADLKRKHTLSLKKWRLFETNRLYIHSDFDFLRVNTSKSRIETSQGVEIPFHTGKSFYNWLKKAITKGGCEGNCNKTILHYEVKTVNKDFIQIGCHKISIQEINSTALLLGW